MKRLFTLACLLVTVMGSFALTIVDGKVYTIANRNFLNTYVKDLGETDLRATANLDESSYWQFIPTGNADCYYVKNVKTGRYAQAHGTMEDVAVTMGTEPVEYKVLLCDVEGTDMYGFASTNNEKTGFGSAECKGWNLNDTQGKVIVFKAQAGTNHKSFWKLAEADLVGSIDLTYMVKNNDFELTDGMIVDGTNFRGVPTNWHAWGMRGAEEYTQEPGVNNTTLLPKASYGANGGCESSLHGTKSYWLNCTPMPDDVKLYQEVSLPAGNYRLTCLLSPMSVGDDQLTNLRMFAGDNASYFGSENKYGVNLGDETNKTFMEYSVIMDGSDPKMQTMVLEFTLDEAATIELGIRTSNMQKDGTRSTSNQGRFRCDYFTLKKVDSFHVHDYSNNGICGCEGSGRFEAPQKDGDYYLVDNAGKLEWISATVAAGNLVTHVKLTADIDFENIENLHSPIGPNTGNKYNGIFDGQGHRIMNMVINRPDDENIGFFGYLRGNNAHTVIRNLIIDKSCSITAKNRAGGIAGSCQNLGTSITIENCINEASVTVSGQDAAGFVGGHHEGGSPKWIIRNCLNTGTITTTHEDGYVGAFFCWSGTNNESTFENLVNLGHIGTHHGGNIGRLAGTQSNIIDLSDTEDKTQGVVDGLPVSAITSGQLAALVGWGQLIGTDAYPSPLNEAEVYSGWTSLYDEATGYELNGGEAKAYTGVINGEWLSLTEIRGDIPARTPVVMNGSYYNRIAKADVPAINQDNDLKGAAEPVVAIGSEYVLAKVEDKVGFFKAQVGTTIAAGKAYLQTESEAKGLIFNMGNGTTGIATVNSNNNENTVIYNLAGQRLSKAVKGLNIINGKKVLY